MKYRRTVKQGENSERDEKNTLHGIGYRLLSIYVILLDCFFLPLTFPPSIGLVESTALMGYILDNSWNHNTMAEGCQAGFFKENILHSTIKRHC